MIEEVFIPKALCEITHETLHEASEVLQRAVEAGVFDLQDTRNVGTLMGVKMRAFLGDVYGPVRVEVGSTCLVDGFGRVVWRPRLFWVTR